MQPSQEPPRVNPGPPIYPPGAVPPNPYYAAPPPMQPARASRFTTLGRGLRFVLRRTFYGFARLGHAARPYAFFLVIIGAMSLLIGWMGLRLLSAAPASGSSAQTSQISPEPTVENFIKSHQSFNADGMWSSYSTDYQAQQLQKGFTKEILQKIVDQERTGGLQLGKYDYVGGVPTDKGTMYFYTIDLNLNDRQFKLPMIFTVDKDGKIVETEGQLLQSISPQSQSGSN